MVIPINDFLLLCLGFFIVATLYSSVGFGGGSSYLAMLALVLVDFHTIRSVALICNSVVVIGSTYLYFKDGYARLKDFAPFVLMSIPFAFLGASFKLEEYLFFILLGLSLVVSALFLLLQTIYGNKEQLSTRSYPIGTSYLLGGGIGFLSGMVGIGGGIFLAPILNHLKWGRPIKIAALASFFILANSFSGFCGLLYSETLKLPIIETIILAAVVLLGGQLGIRSSLKKLTPDGIKRITAVLVFAVGIRILYNYLGQLI